MTDDFPPDRHAPRRMTMPVLTIAALAAAFVLGFWVLNSLRTLETRGTAAGGRIDARLAALEAREMAQADSQEKLARQVATLGGARRDNLYATETDHLVRLAAQRLALFQDPRGADALLAAAENTLREIRGLDTHAARDALARDRAQLRDRAAFDPETAWLRLSTLPDRVDQLAAPVGARAATNVGAAGAGTAATASPQEPEETSRWDRFLHGVRSLVVLRRVDEPVTPALTAGERVLAADHFRLLVEQAQLALLQNRDTIYHDALQQAGRQLERITTGDPLLRSRVRQELSSLDALAAHPLPTLDASLAASQSLATRLSATSVPATSASDAAGAAP